MPLSRKIEMSWEGFENLLALAETGAWAVKHTLLVFRRAADGCLWRYNFFYMEEPVSEFRLTYSQRVPNLSIDVNLTKRSIIDARAFGGEDD